MGKYKSQLIVNNNNNILHGYNKSWFLLPNIVYI